MFEKFEPRGLPDNRHRYCHIDKTDEIIIGGTARHYFNYMPGADKAEVIYLQSLNVVLTKIINKDPNGDFGYIELTPNETKAFVWNRKCVAQVKFYVGEQVYYSAEYPIKIINTLDANLEINKQMPFTHINLVNIDNIPQEETYLYDITFDDLDENFVNEHLQEIAPQAFDCTSLRWGNYFARNFDWFYNNDATFVVHTTHKENRFAVDGIAGSIPGLTKEFVDSGKYHDNYKLVPYYLLDGRNEQGVACSINVVPAPMKDIIDEKTGKVIGQVRRNSDSGTIPDIEQKEKIPSFMLPRYILDNFARAKDAANYIRDYVSVYSIKKLLDMNYEIHCIISDKNHTYVIEFVDNKNVVINCDKDMENKPAAIANFHLINVLKEYKWKDDEGKELDKPELINFNENGTLYTPRNVKDNKLPSIENHIEPHGSGLERWNIIVDYKKAYNEPDLARMQELMSELFYTNAYGQRNNDIGAWYTEFAGYYPSLNKEFTVDTSASEYEEKVMPIVTALFEERNRYNPDTWHTTHSTIYDMTTGEIYICSQEAKEGSNAKYVRIK